MLETNTTPERLLDAAEKLIAENGYANTSLRKITASADANIAAVNYHFGSKEELVKAMLERRLKPVNKERKDLLLKELGSAGKENRLPETEVLLRALIEPAIRFFQFQPGGKHFLRIFSRLHAEPDDTMRKEFLKYMTPVLMGFHEGFKKALPRLAPEKLMPRLFFCIGAMGHGASMLVDSHFNNKNSKLGLPPMPDSDSLVEELISFVTRGMEA